MDASPTQLDAFAAALSRYITTKDDREELAEVLGLSAEAVRQYTKAEREPTRSTVFAIEAHLGLKPGTLSRLLGYLPINARSVVSVPEAIAADDKLAPAGRRYLLAIYQLALDE